MIDQIIAYEQGELNREDTVALFQELVDGGMAWRLQGHYGRTATALIEAGEVAGAKMAATAAVETPMPVWNRGMTIPTGDYRFCEYRDRRWFCVECSVEQRLACGMGRQSKADMRKACAN